jgi:nickel/cobalt transporter (NiCoT) family protein
MVAHDLKLFVLSTISIMFLFGMRHALDVDHITAIDNLVRMHNVSKRAKWVGTGFSLGHSSSIFLELVIIIYVVGSATGGKIDLLAFWGSIVGATALAIIGGVNMISMKKWGRTGSAILASKIVTRTHFLGPVGSAAITGLVFGFGFDTATQISALTVSAVATATAGVQVAMSLTIFFAIGMILVDTLDSIFVRSAFSKILKTKTFTYMSYALSGVALIVAFAETYSTIYNLDLPEYIGPVLAVAVIGTGFGYSYITRHSQAANATTTTTTTTTHLSGHHNIPGSVKENTDEKTDTQ